jgi:hypothetical protein
MIRVPPSVVLTRATTKAAPKYQAPGKENLLDTLNYDVLEKISVSLSTKDQEHFSLAEKRIHQIISQNPVSEKNQRKALRKIREAVCLPSPEGIQEKLESLTADPTIRSHLAQLKQLNLKSIEVAPTALPYFFSWLQHNTPNLTHLELNISGQGRQDHPSWDLSPLSGLARLSHLACVTSVRDPQPFPHLLGLGRLSRLKTLDLEGIQIAAPVHLENLETVTFVGRTAKDNLEALLPSTPITKVQLAGPLRSQDSLRIPKFSTLKSFEIRSAPVDASTFPKTLEKLYIRKGCTVENAENIARCKALETIHIDPLTNAQDIDESILQLPKLTYLYSQNSPQGGYTIQDLKSATTLRELDIDISGSESADLYRFTELTHLTLSGTSDLKALNGLDKLVNLKQLTIRRAGIGALDGIEHATQLTTLKINECPLLNSLPSMAHFPQLHTLACVECNSLKEINGVGSLRQLRELSVYSSAQEGAEITRPTGDLSKLTQLTRIKAFYSFFESPKGGLKIKRCPNLRLCTLIVPSLTEPFLKTLGTKFKVEVFLAKNRSPKLQVERWP